MYQLGVWCAGGLIALHLVSVYLVSAGSPLIETGRDPFEYVTLAHNLLAGHGFSESLAEPYVPNVYRMPGYPLFLAALYAIDGSGILALLIQQVLLIGTAFLLSRIVIRLTENTGLALASMLFVLLEPRLWVLSLHTMSETLFLFLFTCIAYVLFSGALRVNTLATSIGVLSGLLLYTRPIAILYIPCIALGLFLVRRSYAAVLVYFLTLVLLLAPWFLHTSALVGRPSLNTATDFNVVYGLGTDEEMRPLYGTVQVVSAGQYAGHTVIGAFDASHASMVHAAAEKVLERIGVTGFVSRQLMCAPAVWFGHYYSTFLRELGFTLSPFGETLVTLFDWSVWGSIFILMCYGGVVLLWRKLFAYALPLLGIVGVTLFANLCLSDTRMQLAILFSILILAAYGYAERALFFKLVRTALQRQRSKL